MPPPSGDQISAHEVRIYLSVADGAWWTCHELSSKADVAERTARHLSRKLAGLGVLEVERVFNGYRYRLAIKPPKAAREHLARLEKAREVFGDANA
jgi:DNA-binding transcriptional ArsR family regulator